MKVRSLTENAAKTNHNKGDTSGVTSLPSGSEAGDPSHILTSGNLL